MRTSRKTESAEGVRETLHDIRNQLCIIHLCSSKLRETLSGSAADPTPELETVEAAVQNAAAAIMRLQASLPVRR